MELNEERWEALRGWTAVRQSLAPTDVVVAVEAATGGQEIRAGWVQYDASKPTVWSCWALTESALAYVEVAYDKELYDQAEEQSGFSVDPELRHAWCRPLARVAKVDYGSPFAKDLRRGLWFPRGPITVTFDGGASITIPTTGGFDASQSSDRVRLDEFWKVLREAAGF